MHHIFLFTDIEASTRLWEENPDAMAAIYSTFTSGHDDPHLVAAGQLLGG